MIARTLAAAALGLLSTASATVTLLGEPDLGEVPFPELATDVRYAVIDAHPHKEFRELFASPEAIAAVKRGEPMPDGTVITVRRYKALLDSVGKPIQGPDGHMIKSDLIGYSVMEKQEGWGDQQPIALRNGDWRFRTFAPNRQADNRDLKTCPQCHKHQRHEDFVYSREQMLALQ